MSKILNYDTQKPKDSPYAVTYTFPQVDFGAGDSTEVIAGHPDRVGYIQEVVVTRVTETFTTDTTEARVEVGDGTDPDYHVVSANLGALAATESARPVLTPGVERNLGVQDATVTFVAPTGGVPAGIADVSVTVLWF